MQARRRLLMMQSALPGAYRRVEYIQNPASTTAHIDTGIYVSDELRLEIDFQYDDSIAAGYYFMGQYFGTSFFLYIGAALRFQTAFGTNWADTNLAADNSRHKFIYQFADGYLYVLDGETEILKKAYYSASDKHILVAGSVHASCKSCKTYSSKIWRNGALIQDLIPCVRKSDSKPGMYDTVTKTFYTNAGTGEFIVPA